MKECLRVIQTGGKILKVLRNLLTNMEDRGIIYGLVGVIGSGKSYRAEQLMMDCENEGRPVIVGDFSEGIRHTIMNIFTGRDVPIDVNSRDYLYWKNTDFKVRIPGQKDETVSGRLLLQRTAEYLKTLAGPSVWADWTASYVASQWVKLSESEAYRANIIFGSLRFFEETDSLFKIAHMTSKEVKILFCNFKSDTYELNNHISEKLARYFVEKGFNDGDDITEEVVELLSLHYESI